MVGAYSSFSAQLENHDRVLQATGDVSLVTSESKFNGSIPFVLLLSLFILMKLLINFKHYFVQTIILIWQGLYLRVIAK